MKVGEKYRSNSSGEFIIEEYVDSRNVRLRFTKTNYTRIATSANIVQGKVKDPYFPSIQGVGFLGEGKYKGSTKERSYSIWSAILQRCYNKDHRSFKVYGALGIYVSQEWLNFQNFAQWYHDNFEEGYEVDKDLLSLGQSKVYSKDSCLLIPGDLNKLMVKLEDWSILERAGRYLARANSHGTSRTVLGTYPSRELAVQACVEAKCKGLTIYLKENSPKLSDPVVRGVTSLVEYLEGKYLN